MTKNSEVKPVGGVRMIGFVYAKTVNPQFSIGIGFVYVLESPLQVLYGRKHQLCVSDVQFIAGGHWDFPAVSVKRNREPFSSQDDVLSEKAGVVNEATQEC